MTEFPSRRSNDQALPLSQEEAIDGLCDEFERCWRAGAVPRIEDYLVRLPQSARALGLQELLRAELDLLHDACQPPDSDDYRRRFPQSLEIVEAALRRAGEFSAPHMSQHSMGILNPTVTVNSGTTPGVELTAEPDAPMPQRLGRYEIRRVLGGGGFGHVYLAYDSQLERLVAIKVPNAKFFAKGASVESFLSEARHAARFHHPGLVTVYDVQQDGERPYIVQEFIDGLNLGIWIKRNAPGYKDIARLLSEVGEAVGYAHQQGLVHRDLKPANILVDGGGGAHVADFGLALHESGRWARKGEIAGTLPYMSPEQVRGETNRLDGRTDLWSLGVILYEMLVSSRPFTASDRGELCAAIKTLDPLPPRQRDPRVPKELERICLKCLERRSTDRYTAAADLVDDLRHWLVHGDQLAELRPSDSTTSPAIAPIVPKGLRSFDEHDKDFFLELLPGPRDRDGLPDSIRFWKSRIEETDADQTFSVGLLYGPSGCGKSSLLKAGLLPRLAPHVVAVYVESTPDDTEVRLLKGLRKLAPHMPSDGSLPESLQWLRENLDSRARKILIVLDQFEQWLHMRDANATSQLVDALRHCEGGRLQCLALVRDDFWMAATRFMRAVEVRLVEGQNSNSVDLFPVRHAEDVLRKFGRAFLASPEVMGESSQEEANFIRQAVAGLSENGKVICVRLALFAEMMKGRPWTPDTLKEVGGTKGLGATFLEETFSASTAPPEHRFHQRAARSVLKALLPKTGADIKGGMRSHDELLQASGYAGRPREFANLVRILDRELRLITPTDPDGNVPGDGYQLTHDYLVPSLRQWLTQKQRETRHGRAEIRLEDRASLWNARREKNQLPSWWEYVSIWSLTRPSDWSPTERKLMKSANRHYLRRWSAALAVLILAIASVIEVDGRMKAEALVVSLLRAESSDVVDILGELEPIRRWAIPRLRDVRPSSDKEDLHRELALLRLTGRSANTEHLLELLARATPDQAKIIAGEVRPDFAVAESALWQQLQKDTPQEVLAAATVIVACAPDDERWKDAARGISEQLVLLQPDEAAKWINNLLSIGRHLAGPLREIFTHRDHEDPKFSQRTYVAALALARFHRDNLAGLASLLVGYARRAPEFHCLLAPLLGSRAASIAEVRKLSSEMAKLQAAGGAMSHEAASEDRLEHVDQRTNAAMVELMLGDSSALRNDLRTSGDRSLRSTLIHRIALLEIPPASVVSLLEAETESDVRAALILSLGEYSRQGLPEKLLARIEHDLQRFRNDVDAEVHAAAEWLAVRWDVAEAVRAPKPRRPGARNWYASSERHDLVILKKLLDYDFALSATEVTVAQYGRFNPDYERKFWEPLHQFLDETRLTDCPAIDVSYYDAMRYCNWLSLRDGDDPSQFCYEELEDGRLRPKPDHLALHGYRLPNLLEWNCACTAGSRTRFSFGDNLRLLPNYAWYFSNARSQGQHRARAVGMLMPNAFGLFDMYGNVWEWVSHVDRPELPQLCGGSCDNDPIDLQRMEHDVVAADKQGIRIGFRVAQTVPTR